MLYTVIILVIILPLIYILYGRFFNITDTIYVYALHSLYAVVMGCFWSCNYEITDTIFSDLYNVIYQRHLNESEIIYAAIKSDYHIIKVFKFINNFN